MLKINGNRLRSNLEHLGKIGATDNGGVCRFTYSKEYFESVEYVVSLMKNAGLSVMVDRIGNVIGTKQGKSNRMIVMGSHIDSVPNAGIFDGCLGVLGAIEVMHSLKEHNIELDHTIQVAAWAEEEGNTVVGLLGSGAFLGKMDNLSSDAISKLEKFNLSIEDVKASKSERLHEIDGYLELHIEQGGILDKEKIQIGVVNGIVGIERYKLSIFGFENHAGTTPMSLRDDAMLKAAKLIVELNRLARNVDKDMVCTVGWLQASPGVSNVIPGRVDMIIETRAIKPESMAAIADHIKNTFKQGEYTLEVLFKQDPVLMAEVCKKAISQAADELGLSSRLINSGAGHDTMIIAEAVKNCGMIFVPSVGGISHSPSEWTEWEDAENGANVLLNALLKLDKQLSC